MAVRLKVNLDGTIEYMGHTYLRERVATFNRDTDHAVGHLECPLCRQPVDYGDAFCRRCGARLGERP